MDGNDIWEALFGATRGNVPEAFSVAACDVLAERQRQITAEGWTPEHDDEHADGGLAKAAACYAAGKQLREPTGYMDRLQRPVSRDLWPWDDEWWKPGNDRRRQLVKAGALIVAEIERLDRVANRTTPGVCPVCGGDCSSANPPVTFCPTRDDPNPSTPQTPTGDNV